ncbi:amidohydrolase [Alteromonas gilva]|uniref:Amidohydrolase n=1 Tax=Alteromonas gilva TaxID=2987522 RepID=A0ABT5KZP9_9ALTE|nr:amidohydrolase [Alteromonas gilva]MDC8830250.1 amidohydrolase [Alteromonas gilva]
MLIKKMIKSCLLAGCAMLSHCALSAASSADLILTNGDIYTPNGWVESVAIKDGIIIGFDPEQYLTSSSTVVDLNGATVLPGFHDMHVHPLNSGLHKFQCRFAQGLSPETVQQKIAACVTERKENEWITGGQWDAASFGQTPPHRKFLDEVSPNNPVVLRDISGHSAWANSLALELAGITADTPNPEGGIIEKDSNGLPTGLLRESAAGLVYKNVPAYTQAQNVEALAWSTQLMLSNGITSYTDAGVNEVAMKAYATLYDAGKLKQRVRGCNLYGSIVFSAADEQVSADPIEQRNLYSRSRFSPDCVKIVLDGVPTDSHTAAMVDPYKDNSHASEERTRGLLLIEQEKLNALVTDFDNKGLSVKFHAAGDAAVKAGLTAIEAARKSNGFSGVLHDVGHSSFVQMDDIQRARSIAATFEMSPYIWYPNPIIPDITKATGHERMKRWIPVKDAIDAGALVVPGSDWAVVPSVNPWIAIETLVTRQKPGGGKDVLAPQERISLKQAIDLFTVNSAKHLGKSDEVGSISVGLYADLIIVDKNPFKIPTTELHNIKILKTVIAGETVYQSE